MKTLKGSRLARCPACGHQGLISKSVPTAAKLRCSACGARALVRQSVGDNPCRWRPKSGEAEAKRTAATEVLARYEPLPAGGDSVGDLWARDAK